MKEILLLSNSSGYGRSILEHARDEVTKLLDGVKEVVFIPYAKKDYDAYTEKVTPFFQSIGIQVRPIYKEDSVEAINSTRAIYIPGGNTFRLLNELNNQKILQLIKEKVEGGVKYIGSSAGAIIACPTIATTNDMPIVWPNSLEAMGFIPFQLNCHYIDEDPDSKFMGESREDRINEYHEVNDLPVLGLREETWLHGKDGKVFLGGIAPALLFRKREEPKVVQVGEEIKI